MKYLRGFGKWALFMAGLAVLLMFYAQAAWWHWHRLPSGELVGHAHPYKSNKAKEPVQQHQHTAQQFDYLAHFSTANAFHSIPQNFNSQPYQKGIAILPYHVLVLFISEIRHQTPNRAPPFSMFNPIG